MRKSLTAILLIGMLLPLTAVAQQLRIVVAGDIMGHMPQMDAARTADGGYDYHPCFRYIEDYVKSADLAIANLEVTLAGKPYTSYPCFSSPDELAVAVRDAGFDILTTANNHCLDKGRGGLERTLRALDSLGIPHLGTYRNLDDRMELHPMLVERNGIRLALMTYTYGTNGIAVTPPNEVNFIDTNLIRRDLRKAKLQGADFSIVLIHWGIEYETKANKAQESMARWLFENGADAVIGGHPHVVQNAQLDSVHTDSPRLTVYSMGNVVSNQRSVNTDGGIMIDLLLEKKGGSTSLTSCAYMPYWVNKGTVEGLMQYYVVPSADAVEYPERYQISGEALRALTLFDANTRERMVVNPGRALSERLFERRFYSDGKPMYARRARFVVKDECELMEGVCYWYGDQKVARYPLPTDRTLPIAELWGFLEGDGTLSLMAVMADGSRMTCEWAREAKMYQLATAMIECDRIFDLGIYRPNHLEMDTRVDELAVMHTTIPINKGEWVTKEEFVRRMKRL